MTSSDSAVSSPRPSNSSSSGNAASNRSSISPGTGNIRTRKSAEEPTRDSARPTEKLPHKAAKDMSPPSQRRRARLRSPWACTLQTMAATLLATLLAATIIHSFLNLQSDPKGAAMSYMRPAFAKFTDFDTEHTRFASKYSLYLYREGGVDEDTRVKGIPVLFIPGNAGSYKQVRPIAAEAAVYFHDNLRETDAQHKLGKRPLDFFSVDFNEDLTAFHGQTLLDQADYLNEAISYILSLYTNPHRSQRDADLPDPTSVILLGHSMGGIVARTMLTMPNYVSNSVNTILTLAAPHARAPVSFDADIVSTYKRVNDYWRDFYAKAEADQNPLANVATISIAGGGLDTMVPSDYSTLGSLVPSTHGFTVFTSTMPRVWTSMDHLAITWCDQLRRSIVRALYDAVDAKKPNQTRPLPERMRSFKKWFLTGMEDLAEKSLPGLDWDTRLTTTDISDLPDRLELRRLGQSGSPSVHLIANQESKDTFTLLTNEKLDGTRLTVLFCTSTPVPPSQGGKLFPVELDFSNDSTDPRRYSCKNPSPDVIALPASTEASVQPFDETEPFSYLQYDAKDLRTDFEFVAIVDKSADDGSGFLLAEFTSRDSSLITVKTGLRSLISSGYRHRLPSGRSMMTEVALPALHSSLLAYRLRIESQTSSDNSGESVFAPLLRQYINNPFESKFFVNVQEADINMHGVSPYVPPALQGASINGGLTLQLWTDPSAGDSVVLTLEVDILGSMGKLWMRYRTVFAAFPLLVVALVLRKQFQFYDSTGIFMSFTESMDQCLRRSVPVLLLALTFLAVAFSRTSRALSTSSDELLGLGKGSTDRAIDYTMNDLLLGSHDPFFWFLIPLFGLITIGICIVANYAVLTVEHFSSVVYMAVHRLVYKDASHILSIFTEASLQKRLIVSTVLLALVSMVIPYQFVFIVLCIVQLATCVRALSLARETYSGEQMNFYNYTHSIVLLMLWILPVNVPILVVWVRNLAVHWLTPFSSHHNILSIMPFMLLVETLSTGKMVPRITTSVRHLTNVMLFCLAVYAAVYGVTYAYLLHWLVNIVCAWLMILHISAGPIPGQLIRLIGRTSKTAAAETESEQRSTKKRP